MTQVPLSLSEYARKQFGLVTRTQALECLSSPSLYRRLASGVLVPEAWGVYRLAGAQRSWRQRAMAACLTVGGDAVVSHLAAAYLWQAPSVAPPKVQLTVSRPRRSRQVQPPPHRMVLPAVDVTTRWAIPTTTPTRTVIDLSSLVAEPLLERIIDDLIRERHLRIGEVAQRLAATEPLPRRRTDVLRRIVALREGRGIGASPPEDWIVDTILAAGLALPTRNVIVEAGGKLYELDVAYPELKIGIEYDGWQVHSDSRHFHSDRDKLAALQLDGWLILSVTSAWSAQVLVARVNAAIGQRREARVAADSF